MESFEVELNMWKPNSLQNIHQIRRWDLFEVAFDEARMQLQVFSLVPSIRFCPSALYCWPICVMHGHTMQWPPRAADSSIVILHHGAFSLSLRAVRWLSVEVTRLPLTIPQLDTSSYRRDNHSYRVGEPQEGEPQVGINWKANGEWRKKNHKTEKRFAEV